MTGRSSLQARVLMLLALLIALLWVGLEVMARRSVQEQADAELSRELQATTDLLAAVLAPERLDREDRRALFEEIQRRRPSPIGKAAYELIDDGSVILRSQPFPDFTVAPSSGISTVSGEGETWHVLTLVDGETGTTRRAALPGTSRDRRAHDLLDIFTAVWAVLLPLFGILLLLSIWIGLRPLRQIERRMSQVSPHDPNALGLDPDRMPKEIGTLVRAFDSLAQRLARVMSDQRIFASAASHELRTPIAGALSQLEVLRRAPDRGAALERLSEALRHMERLVAQLLSLVRSDAVAAADRAETVDLAALARSAGQELDLGSRLGVHGAGTVTGYPDLLRSLVRNLLRNADQASEEASISVEVEERADTVKFSVLDRGPGIPEVDHQRLLEPFQQGGRRRAGEAGLGLTIARRVAELHGGHIGIANRTGGGAIVSAVLSDASRGTGQE